MPGNKTNRNKTAQNATLFDSTLTAAAIRKLDPELASLTDAQLLELRDALYAFAQLSFEVYALGKYGSKCPVGLFPDSQEEPKI